MSDYAIKIYFQVKRVSMLFVRIFVVYLKILDFLFIGVIIFF